MSRMSKFRSLLRREDGTITVEMLLFFPMLVWAFVGTFVFFDAYRSQATNVRSAYTLGDALSRETEYITPKYMDSMAELQTFLNQTDEESSLRITVIKYDANQNEHEVVWSEVRGDDGLMQMDQDVLNGMGESIPIMAHQSRFIVVESWVDYMPGFDMGIEPFTLYNLSVTRPRFAGQLCWNPYEDGDEETAVC